MRAELYSLLQSEWAPGARGSYGGTPEHGPKAGVACCLLKFEQRCTIKDLMRMRAVISSVE